MRARIGIDARLFRKEAAGIGRYSRELLTRLIPLDSEIEYVVFLTHADAAEWDLNFPNVQTVVVPAKHYSFTEQTTFLAALNAEKLDLVHFLNFNHPIRYRRPFVVTLHDLTLYNFKGRGGPKNAIKEMAFKRVFEHAMKASKRIISISQFSADDAVEKLGIERGKIDVIPNGGPAFVDVPESERSVAERLASGAEPYFLFVSQWRPHKGLGTLVKAFETLRSKHDQKTKLVLVGRSDVAPPELIGAIENSPFAADIVRPGFVTDAELQALYRFSTACVIPSEHEGFGLPILEAFACGSTVIAARNSAIPEVVGQAGVLFPTGDASALAKTMLDLLDDPSERQRLAAMGRERLANFSWDRCAHAVLQTYRRVLGARE